MWGQGNPRATRVAGRRGWSLAPNSAEKSRQGLNRISHLTQVLSSDVNKEGFQWSERSRRHFGDWWSVGGTRVDGHHCCRQPFEEV